MADATTHGLTSITAAGIDSAADEAPVWDNSATTTKRMTIAEWAKAIAAALSAGTVANTALTTNPLARANHTGTQTASTVSDFDTQVRTSRLDQMAAPTADVSMNSHKLTSVTDPSSAQDAATKNYVDTWAQTLNAQTGTTYTLVIGDSGKLVTLSNASSITLTVPPNSSVAFPTGTRVDLAQIGAGQVTVAAGAGVTVNATPGLKCRAQYSGATLVKTATDTWLLFGDLSA